MLNRCLPATFKLALSLSCLLLGFYLSVKQINGTGLRQSWVVSLSAPLEPFILLDGQPRHLTQQLTLAQEAGQSAQCYR